MVQPKQIFGLIGRHVDYSWSPLIHNTGFDTLGIDACYTIFNVTDHLFVEDAMKGGRALGLAGFNVTIPYKKTVVPFLDELSDEAAAIHAVNTIVNDNGKLVGHNTDIAGFAAPLLPLADKIRGERVCIFGNGGAALAAVEAFRLFFQPSAILLYARNVHKAETMLEDYEDSDLVTPCRQHDLHQPLGFRQFRECRVVVNATPIGTCGYHDAHDSKSIVPLDRELLHSDQIVYDMVYNPIDTPLLEAARAAGAVTIPGIEMLIGQAARSFFIWTGKDLPVSTVRPVLMKAITCIS